MWFWLSLVTLICWSGSDLFSKIGCRDAKDKYSHLKMVMAVGLVMGIHAMYEIFANGTEISLQIMLTYLPVSLLYILSMAMGYLGLRYIELSISSPICNSSGALVAVMTLFMVGFSEYSPLALGAVALVCVGAIGLGVVDYFEDEGLDVDIILTSGADAVAASVMSGDAEIGFCGSEQSIYVYNSGKKDYIVNFAALTKRDGS